MDFYVFLVGLEEVEASKKYARVLHYCMLCRALLQFSFCSLYVHPDMHPQALCLSLFLLKLSSEVSEGLDLLIPDIVNEKQVLYIGRLTASRALLPPVLFPSFALFMYSQCLYFYSSGCLAWIFFQPCLSPYIIQNHLYTIHLLLIRCAGDIAKLFSLFLCK